MAGKNKDKVNEKKPLKQGETTVVTIKDLNGSGDTGAPVKKILTISDLTKEQRAGKK